MEATASAAGSVLRRLREARESDGERDVEEEGKERSLVVKRGREDEERLGLGRGRMVAREEVAGALEGS